MRRTEVRPICIRRAISDLLTPARCSFRISAACAAAVAGRPSRFPFSRAHAPTQRAFVPAESLVRTQQINGADVAIDFGDEPEAHMSGHLLSSVLLMRVQLPDCRDWLGIGKRWVSS